MKKTNNIIFLLILLILFTSKNCFAFWIWTPETNKWVNPKYSVKETPAEQLAYAEEFYEAQEYKEAISECEKLIKHYPKAREAAEAQFLIAKCFQDQGKTYTAFKHYQTVIDMYPFSDKSAEIVKIQYDIALELLEGKTNNSKMKDAFLGNDYNPIDILRTVIKNAPYGQYAAISQYKIGLYLMEKRLYQESRDELEKVINDYPDSEWAQAAQYQIAIADMSRSSAAEYDQKVTQAAVRELEAFAETYPDAEFSEDAKEHIKELRNKEAENSFVVAKFYEKQKKYASARIYYQSIIDDYASTTWASQALERMREISGKE